MNPLPGKKVGRCEPRSILLRPVELELDGAVVKQKFVPRLKTMGESLLRRGDPGYAFSAGFNLVRDDDGRLAVN